MCFWFTARELGQMVLEAARASAFESSSFSLQLFARAQAHLQTTQSNRRANLHNECPRRGLGLGRAAGQCRGKLEGKKLQGLSSLGIKSPFIGWLWVAGALIKLVAARNPKNWAETSVLADLGRRSLEFEFSLVHSLRTKDYFLKKQNIIQHL